MRILFVLPNCTGWLGTVHHGKAGIARLSLTTLASLTPPKHEVLYHDSRLTPVDYDIDVDVVAITALTVEANHAYEMADEFRRRGKTVVMGGVHVSALPDEALQHCDSIVIHEAEGVWETMLHDIESGNLKPTYQNDGYVELTDLPIPRRDLLDPKMYSSFNSLIATRGCPFKCDFCVVTSFFGNTFRCRPIDEVVAEVDQMPPGRLFFMDDNLIGDVKYAKELFRALRGCGRKWASQVSINLAHDPELLRLYREAGGTWAFIGLETLSEANLRSARKSFNLRDSPQASVKRIHDQGISIYASLIFGFDDDDRGVFSDTLEFVFENRLDMCMYHVLTPYPGTDLRTRLLDEGRVLTDDWSKYNSGEVVIRPKQMTPEELQEGYHWMHRETYAHRGIRRRVLTRDPLTIPERFFANMTGHRKAMAYPDPTLPFHQWSSRDAEPTGQPIPLTPEAEQSFRED